MTPPWIIGQLDAQTRMVVILVAHTRINYGLLQSPLLGQNPPQCLARCVGDHAHGWGKHRRRQECSLSKDWECHLSFRKSTRSKIILALFAPLLKRLGNVLEFVGIRWHRRDPVLPFVKGRQIVEGSSFRLIYGGWRNVSKVFLRTTSATLWRLLWHPWMLPWQWNPLQGSTAMLLLNK